MQARLAIAFVLGVSLLVASGVAAGAESPQSPASTETVWDGVYTAEQAARGEEAYLSACSRCHGSDLMGAVPGAGSSGGGSGPILAGDTFMDRWREDNLVELFTVLRSGMPRQAVDSISDETKMDIFAFILQTNGFPEGKAELTAAALPTVYLVGKDGPKPLPSTTPVRGVGCLTRAEAGEWTLTRAREPYRAKMPGATTPEEIETSKSVPLGDLTFRLPSLEFAIPGVRPGPLEGHKVQVKGIVYRRDTGNDTINVRSLESLSAECAP